MLSFFLSVMKKIGIIILFSTLLLQGFSQSTAVPFTLEDRDRIMRTEEKVESLRNEMNARFTGVDKKFEGIESKFVAIESRFDALDARFVSIDARFVSIDARFDAMEARFDSIDSKFDAMESKIEILYWGFGIVITLMLFILGYIIYDRRTALHPVQNKTTNLEERLHKLEFITREQAKRDPAFAELLKIAGLL